MMKALSETSVIICGIVRDAEYGLKKNISVVNSLCGRLKDFRIYIYENDSRDRTKEILREWSRRDNRIHVSLNDNSLEPTLPKFPRAFGSTTAVSGQTEAFIQDSAVPGQPAREGANPFYSFSRINKMARLRNRYMEYIQEQGWRADYLMVVDMDVAKLRLGGILDTLRDGREWDAVTANGYSTSPKLRRRYHDTYALTLWGDEGNPQTEGKILSLADIFGRLRRGQDWIRIFSGFGGLALYRFKAVCGARYEVLPNDDPRVEVRCEHFSLHKAMFARGYDRFYINPSMELKYQRLTLSIVLNSLRRRVKK